VLFGKGIFDFFGETAQGEIVGAALELGVADLWDELLNEGEFALDELFLKDAGEGGDGDGTACGASVEGGGDEIAEAFASPGSGLHNRVATCAQGIGGKMGHADLGFASGASSSFGLSKGGFNGGTV
jgi:hypothetical protein